MLEENLHYTIALGKKIGAKEISGFNYAHYSQYVGGMVPKNFINFNFFQDYFYIGSNIPQSGSKGTTIWFEWFYLSAR